MLTFVQIFLTKISVPVQRICADFEAIQDNALKTPENTDDMTQITDYINVTKAKLIAELHRQIEVTIAFSLDLILY